MRKFILSSFLVCCSASLFAAPTLEDANKALQSQKYSEALSMYKTLCNATKPDAKACSSLGYMYQSGKGVKPDLNESGKYYKKACDAGSKDACANAGWN